MQILVSGSLAYDRIMDFPGRFSDHIMPDKLHQINISFTVNGLTENFGGTAGNIAYALSLLGERPRILATIGHDYHRYFEWLQQHGIGTGDIRVVPEEATASAYITTDLADNQITGFNPGAMKQSSRFDFNAINPAQCLAIVAPGNLQDMMDYTSAYHRLGVFAIFDPGQSLPIWQGDDLARCIGQCRMLISNDYELALIKDKTGRSTDELVAMAGTVITTQGEHGAEIITAAGVEHIPTVPADKVVDPTGAGDAFRGGLIKGLVQGYPLSRAARMGALCAHYVIQVYGTQVYRFTPQEFAAGLERHFGPWPSAPSG
ncbi:MAG: carbohydrate kinase family protein [Dehalococcoidia bacterium]|nr:carbohydrate kinase family protein [Dehalococcoidia bacterium]